MPLDLDHAHDNNNLLLPARVEVHGFPHPPPPQKNFFRNPLLVGKFRFHPIYIYIYIYLKAEA